MAQLRRIAIKPVRATVRMSGAVLFSVLMSGALCATERTQNSLINRIIINPVGAVMTVALVLMAVIAALGVILWLRQRSLNELLVDEQQLKLALEHTSILVWRFDKRKRRIKATVGMHKDVQMWNAMDNVPESLIDSGLVLPESRQAMLDMYRRLDEGEKTVEGIFKIRTGDESNAFEWQHIIYTNIYDKRGRANEAIAVCEDVTAAQNARLEYEILAQYDETITADSIVSFEMDLTEDVILKRLVYMPEVYTAKESRSWTVQADALCGAISLEQRERCRTALDCSSLISEYKKGRRELKLEVRAKFLSDIDYVWVTIYAYLICTEADQHILCKLYIKDTDTQKKRAEELIQRAQSDPMTGLLNKKSGQERIEKHLRERAAGDRPSVLIMIDIDNFKLVNDVYGHVVGDRALRDVAEAIKTTFRESDITFRFGGDEFIVLMKNAGETIAQSRINEFYERLKIITLGEEKSVTCSVGAAPTVGGINYAKLLHRADSAMYAAKRDGKGKSCFYHDD